MKKEQLEYYLLAFGFKKKMDKEISDTFTFFQKDSHRIYFDEDFAVFMVGNPWKTLKPFTNIDEFKKIWDEVTKQQLN